MIWWLHREERTDGVAGGWMSYVREHRPASMRLDRAGLALITSLQGLGGHSLR